MNSQNKRKVHAQRKFAQGAYIPPTLSNPGPSRTERATEPIASTSGSEERNVFQNSVSASGLLDIVSFQNSGVDLTINPSNIKQEDTESSKLVKAEQESEHNWPIYEHNSMKTESYLELYKNHIKKEEMVIGPTVITSQNDVRNNPIVLIERLTPVRNNIIQNAHDPQPSTSSVEEPLPTQVAESPAKPKFKLASKNSTMCLRSRSRIAVKSTNKTELAKKKMRHSKIRKFHKQFSKRKRALTPATFSTSDVDDNIPLKYFKKSTEPTVTAETEARVTRSSAVQNHRADLRNLQEYANADKQVFKQPAVPLRPRRARQVPKSAAQSSGNVSLAENRNNLYGSSGIEEWLNRQSSEDREVRSVSRAASPCPSGSFRSVAAVIAAPTEKLIRRCKDCDRCKSVGFIINLQNMMGKKDRTSDTEYEFPQFYLDLDRGSQQIIKIFMNPVGKSGMQAVMVSRSQVRDRNAIIEIEHDNSLEQLQNLLRNSNVKENDVDTTDPEPSGSKGTRRKLRRNRRSPKQSKAPEPRSSQRGHKASDPTCPQSPDLRSGNAPEPRDSTSKARPEQRKAPEGKHGNLVEAPTFHLTENEFNDPIAFFEKIMPVASRYGICKVVAPESFKPTCILNDDIKFNVNNHYISRMYSRWGLSTREMCAIKAYLASQKIIFNRVPLLEGLEGNLYKLYTTVQNHGGIDLVIDNDCWDKVAEEMGLPRGTEKALYNYYAKYVLPYESASHLERSQAMSSVERAWSKKYRKLERLALNPLHAQKKLLGDSDSSDNESNEEELADKALNEIEDCIIQGRNMNLSCFKRVAATASTMYTHGGRLTMEEVEEKYWKFVLFGSEHVCVNAASIDARACGLGFSKNKNDAGGRHPWNLKMLSSNSGNVLRSLGSTFALTSPTLHLGMVFSTYCWHRDPHGLPWIEYMHEGPPKIWYGVSEEQSSNFRKAVEKLCPSSCMNKSIWLSSDITMIPPNLLLEKRVSMSRVVQKPGEYIIVFPNAYACSIATGFTVTESVYFATNIWLNSVHQLFEEQRSSCEPSTFALEKVLMALARDPRVGLGVLQRVHFILATIVEDELEQRRQLATLGVPSACVAAKKRSNCMWNDRAAKECRICRCTLYLSKVSGIIGKNEDVCTKHAIRLLRSPKYQKINVSHTEIILIYSDEELEDMLKELTIRISPKLDMVKPSTPLVNP